MALFEEERDLREMEEFNLIMPFWVWQVGERLKREGRQPRLEGQGAGDAHN